MMDLIAAERRDLAGVLSGLNTAQWQAPSLCAGWAVAHVVAHLTMPFRITADEFAAGMQQARGQFSEFSDAIAERDSRLPQTALVAALRDNAENPWSPPGGGFEGALSHDVIHGLDITWPLGIDHRVSSQAMIKVLDLVVSPGEQTLFGFALDGLEPQATDLDWSAGSGAALRGRGRDLLPLLAGRQIPGEVFAGAGAQRLGAGSR